MSKITVSAARQSLPSQIDRVARGEEIEITRHGRVVAVLVHPDALESRRATGAHARADDLAARLEHARSVPFQPAAMSERRVDELIADVRAGREHA